MAQRTFDETFLRRLDALSIVSRKVVTGRAKGERRSFRKGAGVEFQDHRPYVTGDDLRYVDWNIYSRLDRLLLKLYVEEEDLCIHLLVDGSASMGFGQPPKLDYALQVAAAWGTSASPIWSAWPWAIFPANSPTCCGRGAAVGRSFPC